MAQYKRITETVEAKKYGAGKPNDIKTWLAQLTISFDPTAQVSETDNIFFRQVGALDTEQFFKLAEGEWLIWDGSNLFKMSDADFLATYEPV